MPVLTAGKTVPKHPAPLDGCDMLIPGKTLLVMEYMASGNLWDNLHQDTSNELRWWKRFVASSQIFFGNVGLCLSRS